MMDKKIVIDFEVTPEGLYQTISKEKNAPCNSISEILEKAIARDHVSQQETTGK